MIKINELSFSYNKEKIIDNISLEFYPKEFCCILGTNGSGKTTLLKLLNRLMEPDGGNIFIDNRLIEDFKRKDLAKQIAYLPQIMNAPSISVYELVSHGRFPHMDFSRSLNAKDKEIIQNALQATKMQDLRHKNIRTLSGGERRRAYIAMLIAQDAKYLLLDEPTTYLDIFHSFEIMELLTELKSLDKSPIAVTHDIASALKYSDRLVILDNKQIVFDGTPDTLLKTNCLQQIFNIECLKVDMGDKFEYVCRLV